MSLARVCYPPRRNAALLIGLGAALLAPGTVLAVEVGWRPDPRGGIEYIIQLAPQELQGWEVDSVLAASDVPPGLPPIRSYRIVVGTQPLPREAPAASVDTSSAGIASQPSGDAAGNLDNPAGKMANPANSPPRGFPAVEPAVAVYPSDPRPLPQSATKPSNQPDSSPAAEWSPRQFTPTPQEGQSPAKQNTPRPLGHDIKKPDTAEIAANDDTVRNSSDFREQANPLTEGGSPTAGSNPPGVPKTLPAAAETPPGNGSQDAVIGKGWLLSLLAVTTAMGFAGAVFAVWIAWDYRSRYRRLIQSEGVEGWDRESAPQDQTIQPE